MADLLVVDDDDDLRELLAELLADVGHVIRTARNGAEGLRAFDVRFPQLVITDVEMPELSGPAMVYRLFIQNLGRENIPIILISANPGIADIARTVGTPYRLSKPFEIQTLFRLIDRALLERRVPEPRVVPAAPA